MQSCKLKVTASDLIQRDETKLELIKAKTLDDSVELIASPFSILADVYNAVEAPVAPLLAYKHNKKMNTILEKLANEVFPNKEDLKLIKEILSSEAFTDIPITFEVIVGGEKTTIVSLPARNLTLNKFFYGEFCQKLFELLEE